MEVGDVITINGLRYAVIRKLHKSWGSHDQTLSDDANDRTDVHKSYYVVIKDGSLFWVKEWTIPDAAHLIGTLEDEYRRLLSVKGAKHEEDGVSVRAVTAYGFENHRIIMEYLPFHTSLRKISLSVDKVTRIKKAARGWVKNAGLSSSYDLCGNNVMIGPNGDCVLVDFEMATGEDKL